MVPDRPYTDRIASSILEPTRSDPVRALREAQLPSPQAGRAGCRAGRRLRHHGPRAHRTGHPPLAPPLPPSTVTAANRGEADAGRFLLSWITEAGFLEPHRHQQHHHLRERRGTSDLGWRAMGGAGHRQRLRRPRHHGRVRHAGGTGGNIRRLPALDRPTRRLLGLPARVPRGHRRVLPAAHGRGVRRLIRLPRLRPDAVLLEVGSGPVHRSPPGLASYARSSQGSGHVRRDGGGCPKPGSEAMILQRVFRARFRLRPALGRRHRRRGLRPPGAPSPGRSGLGLASVTPSPQVREGWLPYGTLRLRHHGPRAHRTGHPPVALASTTR